MMCRYEELFGQLAFWGFCVTKAMQDDLAENWDIRSVPSSHRLVGGKHDFCTVSCEFKGFTSCCN